MRKIVLQSMILIVMAVTSGCAGNGINILKPVDAQSKIGIIQFADCDQARDSHGNCEGSGKKVTEVYCEVFGAPVVSKENTSNFDVLITGAVFEYNEAAPMAFRPNVSYVDLKVVNQKGEVLATQKKVAIGSNVFGSAKGCSKELANTLKSEIGR